METRQGDSSPAQLQTVPTLSKITLEAIHGVDCPWLQLHMADVRRDALLESIQCTPLDVLQTLAGLPWEQIEMLKCGSMETFLEQFYTASGHPRVPVKVLHIEALIKQSSIDPSMPLTGAASPKVAAHRGDVHAQCG